MLAHTESVLIASPRSEVWKLVGTPEAWPSWVGRVADVSVEGELRAGAMVAYTYRGRPTEVLVSEYEAGRLLAITSSSPTYDFRETIELADSDGSTRAAVTMAFRPTRWWGRVLALLLRPFAGFLLGRELRRSLASLRRAAERE